MTAPRRRCGQSRPRRRADRRRGDRRRGLSSQRRGPSSGPRPLGNLSHQPSKTWRQTATPKEKLLMHSGMAEVSTRSVTTSTNARASHSSLHRSRPGAHDHPARRDRARRDPHSAPDADCLLGARRRRRGLVHAAGWSDGRLRSPARGRSASSACVELLPARLPVEPLPRRQPRGRGRLRGAARRSLGASRTRPRADPVTDDCVDALARMRGLRHVGLVGTAVSDDRRGAAGRGAGGLSVSRAPMITDSMRGRRLFVEALITDPPVA